MSSYISMDAAAVLSLAVVMAGCLVLARTDHLSKDVNNHGCSAYWMYHNGRCYQYQADYTTFSRSRDHCKSKSADLVNGFRPVLSEIFSHRLEYIDYIWIDISSSEKSGMCSALNIRTRQPELISCDRHLVYVCEQEPEMLIRHRRNVQETPEDSLKKNISLLLTDLDTFINYSSSELKTMLGALDVYLEEKLNTIESLLYVATGEDYANLLQSFNKLGLIIIRVMSGSSEVYTTGSITLKVALSSKTNFEGFNFQWLNIYGEANTINIPSHINADSNFSAIVAYGVAKEKVKKRTILVEINENVNAPSINSSSRLVSGLTGVSMIDGNTGDAVAISIDSSSPEKVRLILRHTERGLFELPSCAFMVFEGDTFRNWSTDGCELGAWGKDYTTCECSHLTTFAVWQVEQKTLGFVSWVGCAVTSVTCLFTSLVIVGYRLMQTTRSYIKMSFLISLGSLESIFLTGMRWGDVSAVCSMFALWMHFMGLSAFCWLLCYLLFLSSEIRGPDTPQIFDLTSYNLIGWLTPACVVVITMIWRYQNYRDILYCWVSSEDYINYSFIVPAAFFILLAAIVMFAVIHIYINETNNYRKANMAITWSGIRSCMFLLPTMSGAWLTACYAVVYKSLYLELIFSFFNTLLGILIFLFMCYFNEEIIIARKGRKIFPSKDGSNVPPPERVRHVEISTLEPPPPEEKEASPRATIRTKLDLATNLRMSDLVRAERERVTYNIAVERTLEEAGAAREPKRVSTETDPLTANEQSPATQSPVDQAQGTQAESTDPSAPDFYIVPGSGNKPAPEPIMVPNAGESEDEDGTDPEIEKDCSPQKPSSGVQRTNFNFENDMWSGDQKN